MPDVLDAKSSDGDNHWFDLALFGHTHGGQINLLGHTPFKALLPGSGDPLHERMAGRKPRRGSGLQWRGNLGGAGSSVRATPDPSDHAQKQVGFHGDEIRLFLQSRIYCRIRFSIKRFRLWKRFFNGQNGNLFGKK